MAMRLEEHAAHLDDASRNVLDLVIQDLKNELDIRLYRIPVAIDPERSIGSTDS